jgi:hypothetical protein
MTGRHRAATANLKIEVNGFSIYSKGGGYKGFNPILWHTEGTDKVVFRVSTRLTPASKTDLRMRTLCCELNLSPRLIDLTAIIRTTNP